MRARHRHFNPRSMGAGLVLDARYIDQADNTAVSTWSDRSGNGWDATQASGALQPTLQTAEFGGQNIVRFDGSNDRFTANGAIGILNNVGGATLLSAVKYNSVSTNQSLFGMATALGNTRATLNFNSTNGYGTGGRRLDSNSFQSVASNLGGVSTTRTLLQTAVLSFSSAELNLFLDGISAASSTSFQTAGNTSSTNATIVTIASSTGGAEYFAGDVGTIVAFALALNGGQRKRVEHAAAFSFKIACN